MAKEIKFNVKLMVDGKEQLGVPGHYFQGHVYINIEDMTKVTGISASDMLYPHA